MNVISLVGTLGQDPELKALDNGTMKCSGSIAVRKPVKKTAENKDSQWFSYVAFGKNAELISQYAKKGHKIGLTGMCEVREYVNAQGENKTSVGVVVNNVTLIGKTVRELELNNGQPDNYDEIPF